MIRLTTVIIHCNKEFDDATALADFKKKLSEHISEILPGSKPAIYNTFETKENS